MAQRTAKFLNSVELASQNIYDELLSKVLEEDQGILDVRPRIRKTRPEDREETEISQGLEDQAIQDPARSRRSVKQSRFKQSSFAS
jgi:hypothetical protein